MKHTVVFFGKAGLFFDMFLPFFSWILIQNQVSKLRCFKGTQTSHGNPSAPSKPPPRRNDVFVAPNRCLKPPFWPWGFCRWGLALMGVTSIIPMIIYRTESIGIKTHVWNAFALDIIQHSPPTKKYIYKSGLHCNVKPGLIDRQLFVFAVFSLQKSGLKQEVDSPIKQHPNSGHFCNWSTRTFIPFKRSLNKRNLIGKKMHSITCATQLQVIQKDHHGISPPYLPPQNKEQIWIASILPVGS